MQKCAQLGKVIERQLKAHRHEVQDGVPQGTFHMFLTKRPSNPQACPSYTSKSQEGHGRACSRGKRSLFGRDAWSFFMSQCQVTRDLVRKGANAHKHTFPLSNDFEMILQWTQLFHHSATSVLMFHPGTILVLHVAFEGRNSHAKLCMVMQTLSAPPVRLVVS